MGGNGSGRTINGGALDEALEDARFPQVDALDAALRLGAVLRQAEVILGELVAYQRQAHDAQVAVERANGAGHFLERQVVRRDGLTIARLHQVIPTNERERILERRQAGETLAAIGADYNVSRQRIAQIVERQTTNSGR